MEQIGKKRFALVTGGSRGIGRAISIKLSQMGYSILINYVSNRKEAEETLLKVVEQGGSGELMQFDVSNMESSKDVIKSWQSSNSDSYIEVVINNAGIRKDNLMLWMQPEEWSSVLNISLNGFFNVTQPLLKDMVVNRFGRVINIVSLSGITGMAGQTNYSAAKGD